MEESKTKASNKNNVNILIVQILRGYKNISSL